MSAEPNPLARQLAYAGLAPFVGGALFIWLLAGRVDQDVFMFVVRAVTSYAALVISFLGGLPWGMTMLASHYNDQPTLVHRKALIWGMGGLLIGCYVVDRRRYHELGVSGWLTMRFRLTVAASLSCFLAAAQI